MSESEPVEANSATQAAENAENEALAARLLAVHRVLSGLSVDSDDHARLHARFMAICTSLKLHRTSKARGLRRLDELIADVERARRSDQAGARRPDQAGLAGSPAPLVPFITELHVVFSNDMALFSAR